MKRSILKVKGSRWCRLEIELEDRNGKGLELSICGSEGSIIKPKQARAEALRYWESYFEEDRDALARFALDHGKRTPKSAARYVVACDGEYHGLDVDTEDERGVFITESCGQSTEQLLAWFPDVAPFLAWHLNGLHAECEHQQARGETWTTHPSAKCPDCGYVLGSAWLRRELPAEVIAWARGLQAGGREVGLA